MQAKLLAVELGPDKIRVNVICPGAISTEIGDNTNAENYDVTIPVEYPEGNIPLTGGKSGSAEQVGELIAFLASDEASHISGTEIWIDGAQSPSGLTCARRFGPEPDLHRPVSSTQCNAAATSRRTPSQGQRRDPNTSTDPASIASKRPAHRNAFPRNACHKLKV
jgi:hypothetical protein